MGIDDLIRRHISYLRCLGRSERTQEAREEVLRRADKAPEFEFGLDAAKDTEIELFLGRDCWAPNTRAAYYSHLAGFYRWAVRADELATNPMAEMIRPKASEGIPNPITDDELRHILTNANNQLWFLSVLAAGAGLRCCEIALLERGDITAERIWVRRGKGGRAGVVDTNPTVWEAFRGFDPGSIVEQVGGRAEASWVSNLGVRRFKQLGLRGVAFHRLRHWYVTSVYRHRNDLLTACAAARHQSVRTTQVYALLDNADRRDAIQALPVLGDVRARGRTFD